MSEPREQALSALYAAEASRAEAPDLTGLSPRAVELVEGVWKHRDELDELIGSVATGWRVERMPAVDRNVLRIAAFELLEGDRPEGVIASEAVELAKRYSTERSGRFVNGIVGELIRRLEGRSADGTMPPDDAF